MINKTERMEQIVSGLSKQFGSRLLLVGLQGSYNRDEAGPHSDFDVVIVLDKVTPADLQRYRALLDALPHRDKACGFICGSGELLHWPRYELFGLMQDTTVYHGSWEGLLPAVSVYDCWDALHIGVAGMYHAACHTFVFAGDEERKEAAKGFCKGIFFLLQLAHYLRTGVYIQTKQALLAALEGQEKTLLQWGTQSQLPGSETVLGAVIAWCGGMIKECGLSGRMA